MERAVFRRQLNGSLATPDSGIEATSPYTYKAPEPPAIMVPPASIQPEMLEVPQLYEGVGDEISLEELQIITQSSFTPVDSSIMWKYETRRQAQMVLPFLYLGPWEVLRSQRDFLRNERISMLLVIRDKATAAAGIFHPKKCAEELGITYDSIDVQHNQELITAFPHAVRVINSHLLSCYREQANERGDLSADVRASFRMGKVLVYCESGNERSAAVVAAYMLTMYSMDLIQALQYVQAQRFCVNFNDEIKNYLKSYEDILLAQRDVRKARKQVSEFSHQVQQSSSRNFGSDIDVNMGDTAPAAARGKRGRDEDEDDDMGGDMERFEGREGGFQPFA